MNYSSKIQFGVVTFFNASAGMKYGFIRVRGEIFEIFFHQNDGLQFCIEGGRVKFNDKLKVSREPEKGDKIAFEIAKGSRGRPKASPWGFRHGLNEGFEYWLAILANTPADTPMSGPSEPGFLLCDKHGYYWWEDGCPECANDD